MSDEECRAELERLRKENEILKANARVKPGQFSLKVSERGGVSAYGLGRFPITLYFPQWEKLLNHVQEIRDFIDVHRSELKAGTNVGS